MHLSFSGWAGLLCKHAIFPTETAPLHLQLAAVHSACTQRDCCELASWPAGAQPPLCSLSLPYRAMRPWLPTCAGSHCLPCPHALSRLLITMPCCATTHAGGRRALAGRLWRPHVPHARHGDCTVHLRRAGQHAEVRCARCGALCPPWSWDTASWRRDWACCLQATKLQVAAWQRCTRHCDAQLGLHARAIPCATYHVPARLPASQTAQTCSKEHRAEMVRYLRNHQNEDGGCAGHGMGVGMGCAPG